MSIVAITVSGSANSSDYSIAAIEYAPTPLQQVGSVKAGLICLPKGKLPWRDVVRPGDHALAVRVEDVLRTGGLTIAPQPDPLFGDAPPTTTYRIKVVVADVKLRLCVAGLGIGIQNPKSQGLVTVRCETFDRVARTKVDAVSYDIAVDDRDADARTASHVLGHAIEASAVRYAASRRH